MLGRDRYGFSSQAVLSAPFGKNIYISLLMESKNINLLLKK